MEPITALYTGTSIAIVLGTIMGTVVIPYFINKAVQTDEGCEPGGSCCNYMPALHVDYDDNSSDSSDFDDWDNWDGSAPDEEPMEYYEMPLPADPRATVELSPIEQEMREAEEYARRHNKKIKVDEAIDNIKL